MSFNAEEYANRPIAPGDPTPQPPGEAPPDPGPAPIDPPPVRAELDTDPERVAAGLIQAAFGQE